ncbi:MAG: hypothetical protein AAGF12_17080 [Myxococcota bacterium]
MEELLLGFALLFALPEVFFALPVFALPVFALPVFALPVFALPVFALPVFALPVFALPVFALPVSLLLAFARPALALSVALVGLAASSDSLLAAFLLSLRAPFVGGFAFAALFRCAAAFPPAAFPAAPVAAPADVAEAGSFASPLPFPSPRVPSAVLPLESAELFVLADLRFVLDRDAFEATARSIGRLVKVGKLYASCLCKLALQTSSANCLCNWR